MDPENTVYALFVPRCFLPYISTHYILSARDYSAMDFWFIHYLYVHMSFFHFFCIIGHFCKHALVWSTSSSCSCLEQPVQGLKRVKEKWFNKMELGEEDVASQLFPDIFIVTWMSTKCEWANGLWSPGISQWRHLGVGDRIVLPEPAALWR
jgi:hypothetical protein